MTQEEAQRLLDEMEWAARQLFNAANWEEVTGKGIQIFTRFAEILGKIQSRQQALQVMMKTETSESDLEMLIATFHYLPQLLSHGLAAAGKDLAREFPMNRGPKPKLTNEEKPVVCDRVSELVRVGVSSCDAKKRAARQFGVSLRSVERAWAERGKWTTAKPEIPFEQVLGWVASSFISVPPEAPIREKLALVGAVGVQEEVAATNGERN